MEDYVTYKSLPWRVNMPLKYVWVNLARVGTSCLPELECLETALLIESVIGFMGKILVKDCLVCPFKIKY